MASLIRVLASALALALFAAGVATAQPASCDRRCLEDFVDRYLDALVRHDRAPCPSLRRPATRRTASGSRWATAFGAASRPRAISPLRGRHGGATGRVHRHARRAQCRSAAALHWRWSRCSSNSGRRHHGDRAVRCAQRRCGQARRRARATGPIVHAAGAQKTKRMSRVDLVATANAYFTGMQQNDGKGEYPFAADCNRIENGMQTTNRPSAARGATQSRDRSELLCAMDLPRAVRVRIAALRHAHS